MMVDVLGILFWLLQWLQKEILPLLTPHSKWFASGARRQNTKQGNRRVSSCALTAPILQPSFRPVTLREATAVRSKFRRLRFIKNFFISRHFGAQCDRVLNWSANYDTASVPPPSSLVSSGKTPACHPRYLWRRPAQKGAVNFQIGKNWKFPPVADPNCEIRRTGETFNIKRGRSGEGEDRRAEKFRYLFIRGWKADLGAASSNIFSGSGRYGFWKWARSTDA